MKPKVKGYRINPTKFIWMAQRQDGMCFFPSWEKAMRWALKVKLAA